MTDEALSYLLIQVGRMLLTCLKLLSMFIYKLFFKLHSHIR